MLYKKELLTIEIPKAPKIPKSFIASHKRDKVHSGTAVCVDLQRSGKILCIDIFSAKGKHLLRFFSDNNNYQVYDAENQAWHTRKISQNLYYEPPCYSTDKSIKIASKFLGRSKVWDCDTLISLADSFISNHGFEQRYRAAMNKELRIERDMMLFDTNPKGLDDFVYDMVFPNHIVIGKSDGKKRSARCARCGRRFYVNKKYKHRDEYNCPKCGRTSILYEKRYIHDHKELKSPEVVFAAQKREDAILYRWYKVTLRLFEDGTQHLVYNDDNREVIRPNKVKTYYYKNLGYYSGERWRESSWGRYDNMAYIFPDGLEDIFPETINNIRIPDLVKSAGGVMKLPTLVRNLRRYPQTEYLVKLGLVRLASEFSTYTLSEGKDWNSIIGINKGYLPLLKKFDVSVRELQCLQSSRTHVSEESFSKFRSLSVTDRGIEKVERLLSMMTFEKFANYFTKVKKQHKSVLFEHLAQWYEDYIGMAEALEIDLSHKSVRYPIDLKKAHDRLAKHFESVRTEIEQKTFDTATKNLKTQIHDFHRSGLMVVLPTCEADFIKEGQSLSHCVGNGNYFREHMKGEVIIVFIRKETEPDKPFVTMQLDLRKLSIKQIYGYADKVPDIKVRRFAEAFVKSLSKKPEAIPA